DLVTGVQTCALPIWLTVKPRRKDVVLVDGSIFLNREDGDLVRIEGRLAKSPSRWTRRVDIVRSFRRFAGVRMPVALESVATLLRSEGRRVGKEWVCR